MHSHKFYIKKKNTSRANLKNELPNGSAMAQADTLTKCDDRSNNLAVLQNVL